MVGAELVNHVSAGASSHGRSLEPPQKAQPISSDLHEPLAAVACCADVAKSSLMPDPTIGSPCDHLGRYGPCSADVQALCDGQKFAAQMQKRLVRGTCCCDVGEKAISLLGCRSVKVTNQNSRIPVKGLEHSRIFRVN